MLNGGTLNYFAVPWGIINNPLPLFAVVAVEAGLMGAVEFYRRNGTGPAGYSPGVGKFESSSECRCGHSGHSCCDKLALHCGAVCSLAVPGLPSAAFWCSRDGALCFEQLAAQYAA
jgi:hypothetical protein